MHPPRLGSADISSARVENRSGSLGRIATAASAARIILNNAKYGARKRRGTARGKRSVIEGLGALTKSLEWTDERGGIYRVRIEGKGRTDEIIGLSRNSESLALCEAAVTAAAS